MESQEPFPPSPLSSKREQAIIESLRRIIRAVDLHSRRLAERHGLTAPQLAVLQVLDKAGPLPAGELAKRVHLSAGTVTGILSRLTQRDWVTRTPSSVDRRRVEVGLSEAGRQALRDAPSLLQDRFRREVQRLEDWEQHQLLAVLGRIASMMDASELDASPHLATGDLGAPGVSPGTPSSQHVADPFPTPLSP